MHSQDRDVENTRGRRSKPAPHYNGGVECIEAIEASMTRDEFIGYLRGNCLKYLAEFHLRANGCEVTVVSQPANWIYEDNDVK